MTEADLQRKIIDLAKLGGWLVHHVRPARTAHGWRTPIEGHAGFPDLVLAHHRHGLILAELKADKGRLRGDQEDWIARLTAATIGARDRVRVVVWHPNDWPDIVATLTPGART